MATALSDSGCIDFGPLAGPVRHLPDPFAPAMPLRLAGSTPGRGHGRTAQRERRARILAAARVLLAEGGPEKVTIRDIAEISNLSIQTIYNLVGNRSQVVETALDEHITRTARSGSLSSHYPNIFLAVADMTWLSAVRHPQYARQATLLCARGDPLLYRQVCKHQSRLLKRLLAREYGANAADHGFDLDVLASQITTLTGAIAREWAEGRLDLHEFRYHCASAYGYPLAGLAPVEEGKEIRSWLAELKRTNC